MRKRLAKLIEDIERLPQSKQDALEPVVKAIGLPVRFERSPLSDFATDAFCEAMGAILQLHHASSSESFTKDKFEHALARVLREARHSAQLAARGNPGHDITVDGESWSLKTQADRSIPADVITISKFMELGKGQWVTASDLTQLRERMFLHMSSYDRIFTLRCLTPLAENDMTYQLVEIKKDLLLKARDFPCEMSMESAQIPKPGYCRVVVDGQLLFQLYFDGGTERKLQIQKLRIDQCLVHVSWTITALVTHPWVTFVP